MKKDWPLWRDIRGGQSFIKLEGSILSTGQMVLTF